MKNPCGHYRWANLWLGLKDHFTQFPPPPSALWMSRLDNASKGKLLRKEEFQPAEGEALNFSKMFATSSGKLTDFFFFFFT